MRTMKWAVVVGLVALAIGGGAVQGQQPPSGEYKIGVLEPLTGALAVQGKLHLEGYEIMRDLINSRFGGVMGKKLVFAVGDAVDPTAAASEATRLAAREGVKIITGTFSSTLCGAARSLMAITSRSLARAVRRSRSAVSIAAIAPFLLIAMAPSPVCSRRSARRASPSSRARSR